MIACVALVAVSSCKKDPKIAKTYELSEEMKAYFVDYEVGTKWIYRELIDSNNFDTIELISKENFDVKDGTTLQKGFELYFKPHKSKDFKVIVSPGVNNTYYVKVDPMVTAAGAVSFVNINGTWKTGVIYFDSIDIKGTKFYSVINSQSHSDFHAFIYYGMHQGLIAFSNMNGGRNLGNYKLIKIIKP